MLPDVVSSEAGILIQAEKLPDFVPLLFHGTVSGIRVEAVGNLRLCGCQGVGLDPPEARPGQHMRGDEAQREA